MWGLECREMGRFCGEIRRRRCTEMGWVCARKRTGLGVGLMSK